MLWFRPKILGSVCSVCRNHFFPPGPVGLVSFPGGVPRRSVGARVLGAHGRTQMNIFLFLPPCPSQLLHLGGGGFFVTGTSSRHLRHGDLWSCGLWPAGRAGGLRAWRLVHASGFSPLQKIWSLVSTTVMVFSVAWFMYRGCADLSCQTDKSCLSRAYLVHISCISCVFM